MNLKQVLRGRRAWDREKGQMMRLEKKQVCWKMFSRFSFALYARNFHFFCFCGNYLPLPRSLRGRVISQFQISREVAEKFSLNFIHVRDCNWRIISKENKSAKKKADDNWEKQRAIGRNIFLLLFPKRNGDKKETISKMRWKCLSTFWIEMGAKTRFRQNRSISILNFKSDSISQKHTSYSG